VVEPCARVSFGPRLGSAAVGEVGRKPTIEKRLSVVSAWRATRGNAWQLD
jgi:hypothetical protein